MVKDVSVLASTVINYFHAVGDFCHLLINFVNSLDPAQDRHSVSPDMNPNCLTS